MNKVERLEDYTNAVIAIVITLMVLDIHAPTDISSVTSCGQMATF